MCTHPLGAWKITIPQASPHPPLVRLKFASARQPHSKPELYVPCGQCMECRIKKAREIAVRATHEFTTCQTACFITLTFNDENLHPFLSLEKEDMKKFWKRFRKKIHPNKIRYLQGSEYGDLGRPHHHAIVFGWEFPDKKFLKMSRSGFPIWTSELLDSLWTNPETKEMYGYAIIQDMSYDAAAYVAKYTTKKITGEKAKEHYKIIDDYGNEQHRTPEYGTWSRKPGLGYDWYKKYGKTDWLHDDKIHISDKIAVSSPRYYDKKLDEDLPDTLKFLKEKRIEKNVQKTPYQLKARDKIIKAKLKKG